MVSENRSTPRVSKTPQFIRFTPHQVALMAQLANSFGPDFCKAAAPHLSPAFIGRHLEELVSLESPNIPPPVQRALNLKQNRQGGYTWIAR
jgi:hypothetical protein